MIGFYHVHAKLDPELEEEFGPRSFLNSAELASAKFCHVRVEKPVGTYCRTGLYECLNERCSATEITIAFDLLETAVHPQVEMRLLCPRCGEPLRMLSYIEEEILLPVKEAEWKEALIDVVRRSSEAELAALRADLMTRPAT